jgi:hypothetical protein
MIYHYDGFLSKIGVPDEEIDEIMNILDNLNIDFKIHYVELPDRNVVGGMIDTDNVLLNANFNIPFLDELKFTLYVVLHEARHLIQYNQNQYDKYIKLAVDGDYDAFKDLYIYLERDANDFAEEIMLKLGYTDLSMFRQNEDSALPVYNLIRMRNKKIEP